MHYEFFEAGRLMVPRFFYFGLTDHPTIYADRFTGPACFSKAIALVIAFLLSGCLVNEPYVRTYDVEINKAKSDSSEVEVFFTEYFLSKGFSVKRKYSVLYPLRSQYIIYEDVHGHENHAHGFPKITMVIVENGKVYLQQEEWSVQPVQSTPKDYIAGLRDDLIHKWAQSHQTAMKIEVIETVDPYSGLAHDK